MYNQILKCKKVCVIIETMVTINEDIANPMLYKIITFFIIEMTICIALLFTNREGGLLAKVRIIF